MSEKDYRATYLAKVLELQPLQSRDKELQAEVVNLDTIRHRLLKSSSVTPATRVHIWEFFLGITPLYKSVRLHTQEQHKEQWSVLKHAAYLMLSIMEDNEQYLLALHLIHTGQLTVMSDRDEISSGNTAQDACKQQLIKSIIPFLKSSDLMGKYFVIHEILLLLDKLNSNNEVVKRILLKVARADPKLSKKLQHREITNVLSNLVQSCFVKALPMCCFAKLLDHLIACTSSTSLVVVGVEIILKNAIIYRKAATVEVLAEEIKSTRLITLPHQICSKNFLRA